MALNMFTVKRWGAFLLTGFLPVVFFMIGNIYYGFLWAIGIMMIGLFFSVYIGGVLVRNPFTMMLEGKGLLTLNIDSTGVIRPFIVGLDQPFVKGQLNGTKVTDVYDRESVLNLALPVKGGNAITIKNPVPGNKSKGIDVKISEEDFNRSRFGLYHYPVLIYNAQLKSMLTKDFLAGQEKQAFAEHGVLYLNRKMEELTSIIRDFGRYVVELTKPQTSILQNKYFWIIIVVFCIIMLILFGKPLIQSLSATGGAVMGAAQGMNAPVVPK